MKFQIALVLCVALTVIAIGDRCRAVSLHLLPVGDVGNAVDPRPGAHLGAVNYQFWLDKYDVTNVQYVEFLNAKASASDPFALYDERMTTFDNGGVVRSASAPYIYSTKAGMANKPVVFVSWFDAIRFTNWLTNGQSNGDTESGSYFIAGGGPNNGVATIPTPQQRGLWSTTERHYLLPSANEWYKAAFYKGGGTDAGYWSYPFATNTRPNSGPPQSTTFGANVADGPNTAVPGPVFLTDVGAYNYAGPYGQMDMGGNVSQFTDSRLERDPIFIDVRGGGWNQPAVTYQGAGGLTPGNSIDFVGFRVLMVPEPGALALAAVAACGALAARRLRRSRAA